MSETKVELGASIAPLSDANQKLLSEVSLKLSSEASLLHASSGDTMSLTTKAGRIAQVTVEGVAQAPLGVVHAIENDLKPENWGNTLVLVGESAAVGVVLRTVLPRSGALATSVGLVMGALFVKDAATPIVKAWGDVSSDGSSQTMNNAAQAMGAGLGDFAVHGAISIAAAHGAVKMTPGLWTRVAPKTWTSIELFKENHMSATSPLGLWMGGVGAKVSSKLNSLADRLDAPQPGPQNFSAAELAKMAADAKADHASTMSAKKIYRNGLTGSDGHSHGLDRTVDLLLAGKDPRTLPASNVEGQLSTLKGSELSKPDGLLLTRSVDEFLPESIASESFASNLRGRNRVETFADPIDKGSTPAPPGTEAQRILNFKTMSAQADVVKAAHQAMSDESGLLLDAVNRATGAVHVRTSPEVKPLFGYEEPRDSMLALAAQIKAEPQIYPRWQDHFTQFAEASIQSGAGRSSDVGMHVARFNEYAKTNFETYRRNIIQAGIDEKVALQGKVVAPIGEVSSDLQLSGFDASGKPVFDHVGPYTQMAVYGPKGEPIWPVDLIKIPLRDLRVRGVQTPGDYGHELMHNQFGRLGAFDPAVRDAKLGEAAARALGAEATKTVKVPNGGIDPQQVLLKNIERQIESLEPKARAEALRKALKLDPELRTAKALEATDKLLSDTGKKLVQIRDVGRMPLNELIARVAVEADSRSPAKVFNEAQGQGDPAATAKLVKSNINKILGDNGDRIIQLGDGSTLSLRETVLKVSDLTRNPHLETYGEALPKTMTQQDLLVNIAKGWADETFADWGAAAESGQFSVLGESAKLSSRTVMGQEMRSVENPLGIEVHQVEKLRPRYEAELIKALATHKGGRDQLLLDWADALDRYSREAGKPGDIVIASLDAPGKSITISEPVMDKFIAELVQQQLNTPLPRLQGHTLIEILPDLRKNFRINDDLSNQWVTAIKNGAAPETIPFDTASAKITNVYGAGQLTFLKLVADGMEPLKANDAVNLFSDFTGNKFLSNNPHTSWSLPTRLKLAPQQTLAQVPDAINKRLAATLRMFPASADRFGNNDLVTAIAAGSAAYQLGDLMGQHQIPKAY